MAWKLALVGLETYEASRFTRPPIVAQGSTLPPASDEGLEALLSNTGLPGRRRGRLRPKPDHRGGAGFNAYRRFLPRVSSCRCLVEVYKQQRLKRFDWDDQLTIGRDQWADGSGVLQARVGDSLKIGELLRLMIVESDNIAANMLADLVGCEPTSTQDSSRRSDCAAPGSSTERTRTRPDDERPRTWADCSRSSRPGAWSTPRLRKRRSACSRSKQAPDLAGGRPALVGQARPQVGRPADARHDAGIIFAPHNQIVLVVLTEHRLHAQAASGTRTSAARWLPDFEGPGP